MKNLVFLPLLALLFLLPSCKNVDTALVSGMTDQIGNLQKMLPTLDESTKSVNGLIEQMNAAPEAMKTDPTFGPQLAAISEQASSIGNKVGAMGAEINDRIAKLQTMAADYADGKIKTEDVKKEFETLTTEIGGFGKSVGRVNEIYTGTASAFTKLMEDWNAKK